MAYAWVIGVMISQQYAMPTMSLMGCMTLGLNCFISSREWRFIVTLLSLICLAWGLSSPVYRPQHLRDRYQHWVAKVEALSNHQGVGAAVQLRDNQGNEFHSKWPKSLGFKNILGQIIQCSEMKVFSGYGHDNPGGHSMKAIRFAQLKGCSRIQSKRSGLELIRLRIDQALQRAPLHPFRGIITAWVNGDASGISKDQWKVLRRTGTAHLMAISGLHIGLLFGLLRYLFRRGGAIILMRYSRGALCADVMALCLALGYAAWVHWPIAAQRASLMLIVYNAIKALGGYWPSTWVWSLSLIGVTVLDPQSVTTPGFWLSFWGVWVLITTRSWQRQPWGAQCAIFFGLLSISLYFFHHIALSSLMANAIAIPVVSVWVVPLSLLGGVGAACAQPWASYCWRCAQWGLNLLWPYLTDLSHWGYIKCPIAPTWAYALGLVGMGVLWMPGVWPIRYWGVLLCLPMITLKDHPILKYGSVQITVLDVGQGLSVAVHTAHHTLLYDAGPRWAHSDAGQSVILPYLFWRGVNALDLMLISHGDLDHRGGAESIRHHIKVNQIMTSVPDYFKGALICQTGQQWTWDGVQFEVLSPPALGRAWRGNNGSCVLSVRAGIHRMILSGDIEQAAEYWLVAHGLSSSEGLVVPHHGSLTSSSALFLDRLNPKWAVISSGMYNQFHLPHPQILKRYHSRKVDLWDTQHHGAVQVLLDPSRATVIQHRTTR
ncbi:MAG: DNA internalization-related competence protein ComEC/Rec2 [Legionellales bacterium]|nr:DNA internalization-related competence protein ComEC/Rec2 [Legionellales bacterium]